MLATGLHQGRSIKPFMLWHDGPWLLPIEFQSTIVDGVSNGNTQQSARKELLESGLVDTLGVRLSVVGSSTFINDS
jgi:hypothetical protein